MSVFAFRVCATLFALAAALGWQSLHWPLPWMLGPLLATSLASIGGLPTRSWHPLRNAGQWLIGTALGLYFTPQVGLLVLSLWWAVLLAIVWSLVVGWVFGRWLLRGHGARMGVPPREQRATCWFAGAIGGAAEMTLLTERAGGRTDLVAAAHSLRVVIVTLLVPFAFSHLNVHGAEVFTVATRQVDWFQLPLLLAVSLSGAWLMAKAGRANPWLLGALLASMVLTLAGVELSPAVPTFFTNAAQLVIGVSLGVRFQADFMRSAPRWLLSIALGSLGLIVACGAFGWSVAHLAGLQPAALILGTAPGGIAEMSITAKVLQLGVPVVTAFQVCRLLAVLVLVGPLFRWVDSRETSRTPRGDEGTSE